MVERARGVAVLSVALFGGLAAFAVGVGPSSLGVPRAAASCHAPPPLVAPIADEVVARNAALRVETGQGEPARVWRDGVEVAMNLTHHGGLDELAPPNGFLPGAYAIELADHFQLRRVPFVVADVVDRTPPTWDGAAIVHVGHGAHACAGGPRDDFYVELAPKRLRDEGDEGDGGDGGDEGDEGMGAAGAPTAGRVTSMAFQVWTAVPPAAVDVGAPATMILPDGGVLVLGDAGGCARPHVPLPPRGFVRVALRPVDAAGNPGALYHLTIELVDDGGNGAAAGVPGARPPSGDRTTLPTATRWATAAPTFARRLFLALVAHRLLLGVVAIGSVVGARSRRARGWVRRRFVRRG